MDICYDIKSPNFSPRVLNIQYVIFHYTEIDFEETVARFTSPDNLSSHYLINKDGRIYSLVPEDLIAFHAGESFWGEDTKLNGTSIGIELVNSGKEEFTPELLNSLILLSNYLKDKYKIPLQNFLGHSDIAPSRKIDPGIYFPWKDFYERNIGIWADCSHLLEKTLFSLGEENSQIFHLKRRLKQFGFNPTLGEMFDKSLSDIIRAFRAHFLPGYIKEKGVDFYFDLNNTYAWTNRCDEVLDKLLVCLQGQS